MEINGKRGCDYKYFAQQYLSGEIDDFCLGYFTHLIADTIYLKDVQTKFIYKYDISKRPHVLEKLGFQLVGKDDSFKYYQFRKNV